MARSILEVLQQKCQAGAFTIGQVRVQPDFSLHHVEDDPLDPHLQVETSPHAARALVLYDAEGQYRPLKTAPNLRRGWKLCLNSLEELRLALDTFYPAALGLWVALLDNRLTPTPWRDTVNRQSGMYRIVGLITDEQSEALFASTCREGCLRHVLWPLEIGRPHSLTVAEVGSLRQKHELPEIPLLCAEACNLLVAAGRPVVKAARAAAEAAAPSTSAADAADS